MKKLVYVLLAVLLLCAMVACGKQETPKQTEPQASVENQTQATTEATTQATQPQEQELEDFMFSLIKMYCKVPADCGRQTNGRIAATKGYKAYVGTIYCGKKGEFSGDLEELLAFAAKEYVSDANKYLMPNIDTEALKADKTQKVTVSGYEAVQFSGPITNIEGGTYQIYGYSMIIKETPVMFLGILHSEDQAQADLEAMQGLVDQMAGSIFEK